MTNYSLTHHITYPKIALLKFPVIRLKAFLLLSFLILGFLLIFYIFQINAEASERHLINKYKDKISQVSRENQNLEANLIEANSLNNIILLVRELNFENIDKIHYIKAAANQMVTK